MPSLRVLSYLASSHSPLLNPDRNPALHYVLRKTFYAQFCAGETSLEVKRTVRGLKDLGFRGVMLTYGKENVLKKGEHVDPVQADPNSTNGEEKMEDIEDIEAWKEGTLKTVGMADDSDFVALKFSGAGNTAIQQLSSRQQPNPRIDTAITEICDLAESKGVRLLFDAEQNAIQDGVDCWTLMFQRRYNRKTPIVYGTYQAYLRSISSTLTKHLLAAQRDGFILGVKLVRGAYMASDPRHIFWHSKEFTDRAHDGIMEALLERQWNKALSEPKKGAQFPAVDLVVASHNEHSVRKALEIQERQRAINKDEVDVAYGQLMGMADEVSCALVAHKENMRPDRHDGDPDLSAKVYKYVVWGSVRECLKYLVRRAEENRDAVTRAEGTRLALRRELLRRLGLTTS